jgi:ABC-type long-subunit fatty acid transport system fused permease/ATPase subunit
MATETKGNVIAKSELTEQQLENIYANVNNALINMTTLVNGKSVFKNLSHFESGVKITIEVDINEAAK